MTLTLDNMTTRVYTRHMIKNVINTLLGKSFPITGNIGNILECQLGGSKNPNPSADLGIWEVKSRMNNAKAYITLGGKKTDVMMELVEQVYNKVKNVIFIEYDVNENKTFTVTKITILYRLNKNVFCNGLGTIYKNEKRSDGQKTLKISRKNFVGMYGLRVMEFTAS